MRILLVDDDDILIQAMVSQLTAHRYAIDCAFDGEEGWHYAQSAVYDLIVLDIDLPKLNGIQLCHRLRQNRYSNAILLLTARGTDSDKVLGLDAGADDYVVKPCTIEELCARIRALLRRQTTPSTPLLEWNDLQLNPATCEVTYQEQLLTLSPKEYGLLELFLRSPQRIFSSSSILEHLWGFDNIPGEETVRTHIKRLRRKLKSVGASSLIDTVYGMGYRLKPALESVTTSTTTDQARAGAIALWDKFKPSILERLETLKQAVAEVETGALSDDLRQAAIQSAHKLTGSLGMFGFLEGSRLSREIEHWFETSGDRDRPSHLPVQVLVTTLYQELQQPPSMDAWEEAETSIASIEERKVNEQRIAERRVAEPVLTSLTTSLLIVETDATSTQLLQVEATRRGMRVNVVADPTLARSSLATQLPDAIVLDLPIPQQSPAGLALLEDVTTQFPHLPVLVLTESNELSDRLAVAHCGGYRFIPKSTLPSQVLDTVQDAVNCRRSPKVTVLVIDDDPLVRDILQQVLPNWGIDLILLNDPRQIWDTLETTLPDLLILDVDMPHINGIDLCRVIRSDSAWNNLPILFLSAQRDAEVIVQLYSAGADDYIAKPFTEPEVVTRIFNRLERQRMLRSLAETDPLTGTATRHRATQDLNRYLSLTQQYGQSLCLAVIDLDHLKQINDRYGHEAGDRVLKRIAEVLQRAFRDRDVVSRWGGEEFLVGIYGMSKQQALKRLDQVLKTVGQEPIWVADGCEPISVTFSAGVSEAPKDGLTLHSLYQTADAAMYQAKANGRNCVVMSWSMEESP
jgi:diguanylate cyclase (GGDEF)-like protein